MNVVLPNLWQGSTGLEPGELGKAWQVHGAMVIIGHPTFHNDVTAARLLADGIEAAPLNFPNQQVAFVITDGTFTEAGPDRTTLDACLKAAGEALGKLSPDVRNRLHVTVTPYDMYGGEPTPGKGSALKLVFDEMGYCDARMLVLLDGDLRNDMGRWQQVFSKVETQHGADHPGRPMFITARYARHFVDASLTRFIVGPLTTLLGAYVPGGISGDIVLSAGAVAKERAAAWTTARRKYGTDISTTMDNIAEGDTVIYEVYLGAKLHDITDEAKLTVMPGEVIGAALERLLHWERAEGAVSRALRPESKLGHVVELGPQQTGIDFIDPGTTDAFDVDGKIHSLLSKFPEYEHDLCQVLGETEHQRVATLLDRLGSAPKGDSDPLVSAGIDGAAWIDILQAGVAFALRHDDIDTPKRCLNYLYTAAFFEFVKDRLADLGLTTFGQVRAAQRALGVPAADAQQFYEDRVDGVARSLALDFHQRRARLLELLEGEA